jgi:hypothetical protein
LGLLPFIDELLEILIDCVFASQERIDEVLFQWETGLDRLLSSPVFSVRFPFNKYLQKSDFIKKPATEFENEDPTVLLSTSPYHRSRMASAPSVFSKRPK